MICIDSDGTAIDSMTVKHVRCFGPCFVEEFGLAQRREEARKVWNDVNLHGDTRGKNRFITLMICLKRFGIECSALENWVENASELSNASLAKAGDAEVLKKALSWSNAVNREIAKLTFDDIKPFDGVKEFLQLAQSNADIAVVSSANRKAVESEWTHYGLIEYVDAVATQEVGSKEVCIKKLLEKGYEKQKALMIGDAPPDLAAAKAADVLFYPIKSGQEKQSWVELKDKYFNDFLKGKDTWTTN